MNARRFDFADRLLGELDKAIKVLSAPARASRALATAPPEALEEPRRAESARMMRVNHAGEVAAQALYHGQALTARDPAVAAAMLQAAAEENDHLAWCELRLKELKGRPSLLNPVWYVGSFAIGAAAGLLGSEANLGFVAETERQVEAHLRGHMERLGGVDERSLRILERMTHDEMAHGAKAASLGGKDLPAAAVAAMRLTARVMTFGSYWL